MLLHSVSDSNNSVRHLYEQIKENFEAEFKDSAAFEKQMNIEMLFQLALCNTVLSSEQADGKGGRK